jgi:CBS domain-containing protein
MWRNDRDRPDDPRTQQRETQRLARDEYDRPRYGSPQNGYGERPPERDRAHGGAHDDERRKREPPGSIGTWDRGVPHPRQAQMQQVPSTDRRSQQRRPPLEEIRVHELMTRRVTSAHPATSIERAVRLMDECDCGALPVVGDNGVLVGMVTDRDIALRIIGRGRDARGAIVADCMTERVFACYAEESVAECMRQMAHHQVRRMPIVDNRGRLVGIIAQGDLARHAARHPVAEERRALTEVVGALSEPSHTPRP